jgi:hypothetical protein
MNALANICGFGVVDFFRSRLGFLWWRIGCHGIWQSLASSHCAVDYGTPHQPDHNRWTDSHIQGRRDRDWALELSMAEEQ